MKNSTEWDQAGIQQQLRASGESHQRPLLPRLVASSWRETVSFVSLLRNELGFRILFFVSIESSAQVGEDAFVLT